MAAAPLQVTLATLRHLVLRQSVTAATVPTGRGQITVLSGHTALLATLAPGLVRLAGATDARVFVTGGYLEVQADQVLILAEHAQLASELDPAAALAEVEAAEQPLRAPMKSPALRAAQLQHLAIAQARLEAARSLHG